MPSTTTPEPPASIRRLCESSGVYPVLVVPWDEPADTDHDTHPGQVYRRGDVGLPRAPENVAFNLDHNGGDVAGAVGVVAVDDVGMWCAAKLGTRALSHLAAGRTAVSAEVDDEGRLSGVALVTGPFAVPAFPSARVLTDGAPTPGFLTPPPAPPAGVLQTIAREADRSGGLVVLNPQRQPPPMPPATIAMDAGAERAELHAASLSAAHEQLEADRRRRDERLAAFAAAEAAREQDLLIRDGVPTCFWPRHTDGYRRWRAHEDQLAAAHEAARLRQAEADRLAAAREAERRAAFAAGVHELQKSWRERERTPAEPQTGAGVPWWLRLFRPAMAAR